MSTDAKGSVPIRGRNSRSLRSGRLPRPLGATSAGRLRYRARLGRARSLLLLRYLSLPPEI
jgi:hypothetical protein